MSKKKTTSEPPQEGGEAKKKPVSAKRVRTVHPMLKRITRADGSEEYLEDSLPDPEEVRQDPEKFIKYANPTLNIEQENHPTITVELGDPQRSQAFNFGLDYMQIGNHIVTRQELLDNPDNFRQYFTGEEKVWLYVLHSAYNIHKSFSPLTKAQEKKLAEIERRLGLSKNKGSYRLGIHSAKQFFKDKKQLSLFDPQQVEDYVTKTGLKIKDSNPDSFGVVLNVSQMKVFEGIVKAFSETNYKGDQEISTNESLKQLAGLDINSGAAREKIAKAYKDKPTLPVVQITQSELLELSGYSRSFKDKTECIEALNYLGSQQFCFFWKRLVSDNKGNPIRDSKSGKWAKEEVMEVGTLFRIKYIKEEGVNELKYYEIHPSAALIDQIDNYFLMIPYNWREEVKQITGNRGSKYTYEFLIWLRLKFEEIRRHNNRKGRAKPKPRKFEIPVTWEEIAIALGMPETIYKANRLRGKKIIDKAYSVAIKLGYLLKVEDTGAGDLLYLNEDYYPQPGDLK